MATRTASRSSGLKRKKSPALSSKKKSMTARKLVSKVKGFIPVSKSGKGKSASARKAA